MNKWTKKNIAFLFSLLSCITYAQKDCTYPLPPLLSSVTIQPETGATELNWVLSPSSDVIAYLVFEYHNENGIPRGDIVDTVWNPAATSYTYINNAIDYFSSSYVVSALGIPNCESSFSNILNTIFCTSVIDTCRNEISINWNPYPDYPKHVLEYRILVSKNGSPLTEMYSVGTHFNSYIITDFETDSKYCFAVKAILEGGAVSCSNTCCLSTNMQRPPQWINADYATVTPENVVKLSFTIDPLSEITTYNLEKKTASGIFGLIAQISSESSSLNYSDNNADLSKVNYYRIVAINNCVNPVAISNIASNIVLSLERNEDEVTLKWNPYKEWMGVIGEYKLYINTINGMEERSSSISTDDSTYLFKYSDLMYEVVSEEICFIIKAVEASNPHGSNGESQSSVSCTPITENIFIPNTFTPDNNNINDRFTIKLSFTPASYHLIITDLQRKTLFETSDPADEWNGTKNGTPVSEGAYLWFLKLRTPSGKNISKSGTVTLIINR